MYWILLCALSVLFCGCSKNDSQGEPYVIEGDVYEPVDPLYYDEYDDDDRYDHDDDHHERDGDGGHGGEHSGGGDGGGGHGR